MTRGLFCNPDYRYDDSAGFGLLMGRSTGNVICLPWKSCRPALTSAGIGVGMAVKYGEDPLCHGSLRPSAAMVGGYPQNKPAAHLFVEPEMPLWRDLGETARRFPSQLCRRASPAAIWFPARPKVDIIVTPGHHHEQFHCRDCSSDRRPAEMMTGLGSVMKLGHGTAAPSVMGVVVSVVMGIGSDTAVSSAALGIILRIFPVLPPSAATNPLCCNMVGFARLQVIGKTNSAALSHRVLEPRCSRCER